MKISRYSRPIFWTLVLAGIFFGIGRSVAGNVAAPSGALVINEMVAANQTGLTDEDGDHSDWIELYNPGSGPLNLAGWALTDDPRQPQKWSFPDMTLSGGGYLVVFASGKNRQTPPPDGQLHTNFRLRREGEFLALYSALDDKLMPLAESEPPGQFGDVAYGRPGDANEYAYLATATPGQPNDSTVLWQDVAAPVRFSVEHGFYESPFLLELSSDTPEARIRYTLDGSRPSQTNGLNYSQPLAIESTTIVRAAAFKPEYRPSAVKTHSYIFLAEVLAQSAAPPEGFPASWGIYRQTYKVAVEGEPVPTDYEMDPAVVNDPRYRNRLPDDLKSIPSLFLTIDREHFDIYTHPRERGREWERPASVELFDPQSPAAGFQIDAGLRIQGDLGREEYIPKHSFRLFFRQEYGPGRLEYPLFPDSPVESFDTLILRGGVQSSYVSVWKSRRRDTTYTRDEWLRASQIEMSGLGSHGIFVHLYLNGLYWGLYNVVERPDHNFAASYLNIKEEEWYAFNHSGIVNGPEAEIKALLAEFEGAATLEEKIGFAKRYIDTTAFADYVILNWYAGTGDWPNNNWYAGFQPPNGKINYFVWDGELTWRSGAKITFGLSNPPGRFWPNTVEPFFRALIQDPDFKLEFGDRMYKHLFNNGALTAANAQQRWLEINSQIDRAIVAESARWGDTRETEPLTRADWLEAVDNVVRQMEGNPQRLIQLARQHGYYPPLDPPAFNRSGGLVGPDFELTISAAGDVYFTTDGSDPRQPGLGAANPAAQLYRQPIAITRTTQLKARARNGDTWSALNQATFSVAESDQPLRITELMYNPPDSNDFEFVELQNIGDRPLDLSGMAFEGIRYIFPANSSLEPGGLLVLASNADAFASRYPQVEIAGEYRGQLSNAGESLVLRQPGGAVVTSVAFDDDNGWPISPDGRGDSLVFVNLTGDPNDPKNWRASHRLHGSPGAAGR